MGNLHFEVSVSTEFMYVVSRVNYPTCQNLLLVRHCLELCFITGSLSDANKFYSCSFMYVFLLL